MSSLPSSTCPRSFEAEALRDGRLGGSERERYERHLASCDVCTRETEALEKLATALRNPTTSLHEDELRVRRERTRLLSAFNEALLDPSHDRSPRTRLWRPAFAVAAALVAVATLFLVLRPPHKTTTTVATPSLVHVEAQAASVWSKRFEGERERITLERGTLSIRVEHRHHEGPHESPTNAARRLLVLLPDGELEDRGTTFSVTADNGRTTRIEVTEGSVALRLHGAPTAILINAGESWTPPPIGSTQRPSSPTSSSAASTVASSTVAPTPSAARVAIPTSPTPSSTTPVADTSSADFRAAMASLNGGESRRAAEHFAAFGAKHPGDARAEDAAYLRVIALQRSGDIAAMREAAKSYIQKYPNGFRRSEIDGLLSD